ncbi:MAG TPA: hypothetical protein VGI39_28765 [Polyangiaceae bacterium]|jgi:hypothetical protein
MPPHRSAVSTAFIDPSQIDALLAGAIPDAEDRAFVVRCILGEGPAHHRGVNYVLLRLLGLLVERLGGADMAALRAQGTTPVPMKVPPHLERQGSLMAYPIGLPLAPLSRLAPEGTPEQAAMVECLSDGPPQHALANAAMLWLIGAALQQLPERAPARARSRSSVPPKR